MKEYKNYSKLELLKEKELELRNSNEWIDKIYVYKLVYKNGDYVEYSFSTGVNNDL